MINETNIPAVGQTMPDSVSHKIGSIFKDYSKRLLGFIRPRVNTEEDAEDILQEVFYELSEAMRLMQPVEQVTSWLFTVARNRITDLYRKKKPLAFSAMLTGGNDEEEANILVYIEELLSASGDTPEDEYLRSLVWIEVKKALDELPREQRDIFEQHELKGKSFKEISAETGLSVNTLISRKRYAVLHLRERLSNLYNELINF